MVFWSMRLNSIGPVKVHADDVLFDDVGVVEVAGDEGAGAADAGLIIVDVLVLHGRR